MKKSLTVKLEKKHYDYLQKLSFKLSLKENRKICLSEIVRIALERVWPIVSKAED